MFDIALLASGAALGLLPQMAFADPARTRGFSYDGDRYVYSVVEKGPVRIIRGNEVKSGRPFRLVVGPRFVTGSVAGTPVSFSRREVVPFGGSVSVDVAAR